MGGIGRISIFYGWSCRLGVEGLEFSQGFGIGDGFRFFDVALNMQLPEGVPLFGTFNSLYRLYWELYVCLVQETMSKEHAMRFPFIGSAVLLSLFLLFKFLPKDLINTVLTLYFFVLGVLALSYVTFYPS